MHSRLTVILAEKDFLFCELFAVDRDTVYNQHVIYKHKFPYKK